MCILINKDISTCMIILLDFLTSWMLKMFYYIVNDYALRPMKYSFNNTRVFLQLWN